MHCPRELGNGRIRLALVSVFDPFLVQHEVVGVWEL
jgi:hypothetical protein